jgi:Ran GTPase-activating protein (RanGAP) involved in mRNA processing and transport
MPPPHHDSTPPTNIRKNLWQQQQLPLHIDGSVTAPIPPPSSATNNNNNNNNSCCLTLEFTSVRSSNSSSTKENTDIGSIRKVELSDGSGSLRFVATLPSHVDGEQANLTAALLFEQIDQLPCNYRVERVKFHSLQFSNEAILAIHGFLSMYVSTIKYVSIKDSMTEHYTRDDEQSFVALCNVFASTTTLETLNLSDNTISASVWKCWSPQTKLQQLILDYVEMDDDSLCAMAQYFTYGDTLEELYVVLTKNIGPRGLLAANAILKCCRLVGSLRWAVKDAPPDAFMPWRGLAEMAREMTKTRGCSYLLHLVMDGGTISDEECGPMGLGGALEHFSQLKSIKLRSIGLNDSGALHVSAALLIAQPALDIIDFSRNVIQSSGATALAKLSDVEAIAKNLTSFSLERNNIDGEGARIVLEAFGMHASSKLDVKLDGNTFNFSKVAFNLAWRKGQVESDRDQLYNDLQGSNNPRMSDDSRNDILILQEEVHRLQEEKAVLMRAFAMIGNANQVDLTSRTFFLDCFTRRRNKYNEGRYFP